MAKNEGTSRKKIVIVFLIIFAAGVVFAGLFNVGLAYTNTTEFCTSCHTMQIPFGELKERPHWQNPSGVHAGCADCHVPKEFFPKM
ncbi:MAG: cytochrome C, partial [Gammaproteobacteria bacterium]